MTSRGQRPGRTAKQIPQPLGVAPENVAQATFRQAKKRGPSIRKNVKKKTVEHYGFKSNQLYESDGVVLYHADCMAVMDKMIGQHPVGKYDMIFADPPYFLSNGGISCRSGKMVSVNKGHWDASNGVEENHKFNLNWLSRCRDLLKDDGTIWVSGTHHVIHSVGYAMQCLGMKILNEITWEKPNPPPNLSCRYFTHSTETILWAAKTNKSKHCFNYHDMREENGGKQMKTVWRMTAPSKAEKTCGKHPTQKPIELLNRIILSSTTERNVVFDPFTGSGTTCIAAMRNGRLFEGCESEREYINLAISRISGETEK